MPIQPRHDYVLVRIEQYRDYRTPISAVIVPAEAQIDNVTGTVEAVGPDVRDYRAGDHVLFAAPMGEDVSAWGPVHHRLIAAHNLLGTFTPPDVS